MKKWLGIILLAFSLLSLIFLVNFSFYGKELTKLSVDKLEYEEIVEGRVQDLSLNSDIYFDQQKLTCTYGSGSFFYSMIEGSESATNPKVRVSDRKLNIRFLEAEINEETVENNIPLKGIIYSDSEYREFQVTVTTLPIMTIDFGDTELTYEDKTAMRLSLFDNSRKAAARLVESDGTIRIRGANSKFFPQPGYKLDLTMESLGDNTRSNDISLLGMRKDDDWILASVYADSEMVRTAYCMNLWERSVSRNNKNNLDTGVTFKYVEVIMNGEYNGLFALGYTVTDEQVAIDSNAENEKLYKKVTWADETKLAMTPWGTQGYLQPRYSTYSTDYIDDSSCQLVLDYYYQLWENIDNPTYLYTCIDRDNAIDIMLFFNLIQGVDNANGPFVKNFYLALKDEGDYISSLYCPWDMDLSFGSTWCGDPEQGYIFSYDISPDYNSVMENGYLYAILANGDHELIEQIYNRYFELRNDEWSDEKLMELAEECEDDIFMSGAFIRENNRWPDSAKPVDGERLSKFKSYVLERAKACDDYMERFHELSKEHGIFVLRSSQYKNFMDYELTIGINNHAVLKDKDYIDFFNYINLDTDKITEEIKTVKGSPNKGYEFLTEETQFVEIPGDGITINGPKDIVLSFTHENKLTYMNFIRVPEMSLSIKTFRDPYNYLYSLKMIDGYTLVEINNPEILENTSWGEALGQFGITAEKAKEGLFTIDNQATCLTDVINAGSVDLEEAYDLRLTLLGPDKTEVLDDVCFVFGKNEEGKTILTHCIRP